MGAGARSSTEAGEDLAEAVEETLGGGREDPAEDAPRPRPLPLPPRRGSGRGWRVDGPATASRLGDGEAEDRGQSSRHCADKPSMAAERTRHGKQGWGSPGQRMLSKSPSPEAPEIRAAALSRRASRSPKRGPTRTGISTNHTWNNEECDAQRRRKGCFMNSSPIGQEITVRDGFAASKPWTVNASSLKPSLGV